MSFIIVVNRLDVLINRIERLTSAITGVPIDELPPVVEIPELVISQPQLPNRYKIFRVDLSVVRADEPLGVGDLIKDVGALYASYMSIITVPAAFQFKLNSTDMDDIDAAVGLEQENFEITEVFITNAAGAGTALINVEYRVD
ncbi:hypothetical protein HQ586_00715 [Candidatus Bathyarchaeota archaeon]|nr:hypothetical protein [Candidatus Bathyarchaeota archaeon]